MQLAPIYPRFPLPHAHAALRYPEVASGAAYTSPTTEGRRRPPRGHPPNTGRGGRFHTSPLPPARRDGRWLPAPHHHPPQHTPRARSGGTPPPQAPRDALRRSQDAPGRHFPPRRLSRRDRAPGRRCPVPPPPPDVAAPARHRDSGRAAAPAPATP